MIAPVQGAPAAPIRSPALRVPDRVLYSVVGEEAVLLDLRSGRYFGLDSVGTRIWCLLTTGERWSEAFETLLTEYDVSPERLRIELAMFVEGLVEAGLVEAEERSGG